MSLTSTSVEATEQIAADLVPTLVSGDVIALDGELGAGKTQFVRGLVRALGGEARSVSSPTFVLLNVYPTPRLQVFHLDAYRVGGADDFDTIGFAELLEQGGLVVVEWASRVQSILPPRHVEVRIERTGLTTRCISMERRT